MADLVSKTGKLRQAWNVSKAVGPWIIGFVLGCVACSFWNVESISFKGAEIRIREVNDPEYLERVWADESRRDAYLLHLAGKGVFEPSNRAVVDSIATLCDELPVQPLEAYLAAARECAERPVPQALRDLARRQARPFHPSGKVVTVSVPVDQPPSGKANTCHNGEWHRRYVVLTNPHDGRQITVHATGHFGRGICGPVVGAADFQLNEQDALQILDGPLGMFEEAVAIIE